MCFSRFQQDAIHMIVLHMYILRICKMHDVFSEGTIIWCIYITFDFDTQVTGNACQFWVTNVVIHSPVIRDKI